MGDEIGRSMPTELYAASLRADKKEIGVTLGEYQYRIGREKQGLLITLRAYMVRGIILKTEQITVDQWIDELSEALAQLASHSAQSRVALEQFLIHCRCKYN